MPGSAAVYKKEPPGGKADASEIIFYHDPDDTVPLPSTGVTSTVLTKSSLRLRDADNASGPPSSSGTRKRALSSATYLLPAPKKVATRVLSSPNDHIPLDNDNDIDDDDDDVVVVNSEIAQMCNLSKSERTADIRTIFTRTSEGQWVCNICKDAHEPANKHVFRGGTSTLRTHILRRQKTHFHVYKQRCEAAGIMMNHRAIPPSAMQMTLDSSLVRKLPTFTKAGLLEHIMELVVTEDDGLKLIDKPAFRNLLHYVRPSLTEEDIPHRTKLTQSIKERAGSVVDAVRQRLAHTSGQISMTFNSWTSVGDPFLSVTGHYIWNPVDKPQQWELRREQLAFDLIEGNHSGQNIGRMLLKTIDEYNICNKVGWITSDNASNNDVAMKEVAREIDPAGDRWHPDARRIRCQEDILNLTAKHFVDDISPTPQATVLKTTHQALDKGDDVSLDPLDDELEKGLTLDAEEKCGDAVDKALVLIEQICKSPQARAFFAKACEEEGASNLELSQWVKTRSSWTSLYESIDRLLLFRSAVDRFTNLADESSEVPKLRNKCYQDFKLECNDWTKLELVHHVLKEPATAQQSFSANPGHPTAWRMIPTLECLADRWQSMLSDPNFAPIVDAIDKGLDIVQKYYCNTDDTDAYFICLVLDPNYKLAYVEGCWDVADVAEGKARLERVFDNYYKPPGLQIRSSTAAPAPQSRETPYGEAWMRGVIAGRQNTAHQSRDELTAYLTSPLEEVADVVAWWGLHSLRYPTLARIARDYLPIQGSTVSSEQAFSRGDIITSTLHRNSLEASTFTALQLLKAAYKDGHVFAVSEATKQADISR